MGVGQPASNTASQSVIPSWCLLFGFDRFAEAFLPLRASFTVHVGQPANVAASRSEATPCLFFPGVGPVSSLARGVGHPVKALPDVGRSVDDAFPSGRIPAHNPSFGFLARARRAQICGPDSIAQKRHASTYSGEPLTAQCARNLLSIDFWRAAACDKPEERRE
jgi:hypothetical protein